VIFTLEKMDSYLVRGYGSLASYQSQISDLAEASEYKTTLSDVWPAFHIKFNRLYESITQARNDAMHQGAYARHLAKHGVDVALILEDAIMSKLTKVEEVMVPSPVSADSWQPVSHVRMTMLRESFSYLPILWNNKWHCVSDCHVARYLRQGALNMSREQRLCNPVADAVRANHLVLTEPLIVRPGQRLDTLVEALESAPALVVQDAESGCAPTRLLGIITAFDLL